jgi:hypothetical protein
MAGVNRYDTPSQASFINSYVPIPFDEMMKMGMMKQQMVEQNDQIGSELMGTLGAMKVAPADEASYLDKRNQIQKQINDIYSNTQPGSYEGKKKLMDLRTQVALDPTLRAMTYNLPVYTQSQTELQEGRKNGIPEQNLQDLMRVNSALGTGGAGTTGLMKANGTGIYSSPGYSKYENYEDAIAKQVKDVASSSTSIKDFKTDATGKYVVTTENAGKSLNALGAPFGLSFNGNVDTRTNRLSYRAAASGITPEAVSNYKQFLTTPAGEQLVRDAQYNAQKDPNDPNGDPFSLYMQTVTKAINANITTNSKYSVDYDPLYEAEQRLALTKKQPVYTMPVLIGEPNRPDMASIVSVEHSKNIIGQKILDIQKAKDEYVKQNGIDLTTGKDSTGADVTSTLADFNAQVEQEKAKQTSYDGVVAQARKDAHISDNWQLSDQIKKDASDYAQGKVDKDLNTALASVSKSGTSGEQLKIDNAEYSKDSQKFSNYYNEYVNQHSPEAKAINEKLKQNAADHMVNVGVTSFPTTTAEKEMEDIFNKFANEGSGTSGRLGGGNVALTDAKTGKPFTDDQYKDMSRTITNSKGTGEEKQTPQILGMFYHPEKGWPQILVRPTDKNGKMLPQAYWDAPEGTEQIFIEAGRLDAAKVMVQRELANANSTPNQEGRIGARDPNAKATDYWQYKVIKPSTQQYSPQGNEFEVTYVNFTNGQPIKYQYSNRDELANAFIRYQAAKYQYEHPGTTPNSQ